MLPLVLFQILESFLKFSVLLGEPGLQFAVAADGMASTAGGLQGGLVVKGEVVFSLRPKLQTEHYSVFLLNVSKSGFC